jgi:hypothetical protein
MKKTVKLQKRKRKMLFLDRAIGTKALGNYHVN